MSSIPTRLLLGTTALIMLGMVWLAFITIQSTQAHGLPMAELALTGPDATTPVSYLWPVGAKLSDYITERTFLIANEGRQVLFMHPPSSAHFKLQVPEKSLLKFTMALQPDVWDKPGDGVDFVVRALYWDQGSRKDKEETLFSQYVDPRKDLAARAWLDATVDLDRFSDQVITLTFQTLPHDSPDYDWAGWNRILIARR